MAFSNLKICDKNNRRVYNIKFTLNMEANMPEDAVPKSTILIDAKFGSVTPGSIEVRKDKNGKDYVIAKFVSFNDKAVTLYVRGKNIEALNAKAATGKPFLVVGELIAKGTGFSVSSFSPKAYTGTIQEIGKEGAHDGGPWIAVKMLFDGKEKPWSVLLTGNDVTKVKALGIGAKGSFDLVWKASKSNDRWGSSAVSSNSVERAKVPEPA